MSTSRVNSAFELVSAIRQSNTASAKRLLDETASSLAKTSAADPEKVDDRRKLAVLHLKSSNVGASVRRYFNPSEIQELAGVLQELATSNAELGVALAMAAQEYVPQDHRGFGFWDYFAINLYKAERNADGYLIWNRAVSVPVGTSEKANDTAKSANAATTQADPIAGAVTTKALAKSEPRNQADKTQISQNASEAQSPAGMAAAGPVGSPEDSDSKKSDDKIGKSSEKELPLRPRARKDRSAPTSGSDDSSSNPDKLENDSKSKPSERKDVAITTSDTNDSKSAILEKELPVRPRVRAKQQTAIESENQKSAAVLLDSATVESKLDEKNESDSSGSGEKVVEMFCKSDYGNMGHIRNNMCFALQKLKCGPVVKSGPGAEPLATVDKLFQVLHRGGWTSRSIPLRFHAFNPSIITHPTDPNKFLVNLRAGNYFMNQNHKYEFPPGMSGITTLNFLGSIAADFRGSEFGDTRQIKAPPMPNPYPEISGLEDIRLIWEPQSRKLYASFTSLEVTPEHRPQVCLMQLDHRKGRIIGSPVRLHGFDSDKTQKNWIGFADGGKLFFIHSLQPITVVQANPKTGEVRIVSVDATPVLNEWRGSSPLVELSGDLLEMLPHLNADSNQRAQDRKRGVRWFIALVHISHFPRYHHQFIVVRKTPTVNSEFRPFSMAVTHQSPPFVFESHDVEFSCGMAFTPDHSEIVVPYSKRDNQCTCIRIDTSSLLAKRMQPIPEITQFQLKS